MATISTSFTLSAFLSLFFPLLAVSVTVTSPKPSATPPPSGPSTLLQRTCNATSYYDFCLASLQSDPQSANAADARALSAIAVGIAMSNATNTSSFAAALAANATDASLRGLLRTCSSKYAYARQALQESLDALGAESYDYAFVQVSAAAEYPNVCRVLFRQKAKVEYPAQMARREEVLERLCAIALGIIALLG